MKRIRGFRLGRKVSKVFKWVVHPRRPPAYQQSMTRRTRTAKAVSNLCSWARSLRLRVSRLCFAKPNSGYVRVGEDPADTKPVSVPKGHLAVYVGEEEDYAHRVLVPVIYFNHPLFGELLKEAEKVYGFNHRGGIQIPCRISEFENVQTKIAAGGGGCRVRRSWRLRFW